MNLRIKQYPSGQFWIAVKQKDGQFAPLCSGGAFHPLYNGQPRDFTDLPEWAAIQAVRNIHGTALGHGFVFESRDTAETALRAAKTALKKDGQLPLWARKSLSAGWTPPSGWLP